MFVIFVIFLHQDNQLSTNTLENMKEKDILAKSVFTKQMAGTSLFSTTEERTGECSPPAGNVKI